MIRTKLRSLIEEYSRRNKECACNAVYSVTNSQGFVPSTDYFSKEVFSKDLSIYKIVRRGMIAYNPSRVNVGSIAVQSAEDEVIVSPLYVVFKVKEDVLLPEFLTYFLRSEVGLREVAAHTSGSVRDSLKFSALQEIEINLCSIEQQKEIVAKLKKIEQLLSQRQLSLHKIDELVKSQFIEMFGDVVQNNKNWEKLCFGDITESRLGKMLDAKKQKGLRQFPYLANYNVQWFRFNLQTLNVMDFDEKEQVEFSLKDGDLLVCEGGEIGRCAIWHNEIESCYFQKALHRVRCNYRYVLPIYLAWWFKYNCDNNGFADIEGAKATISHLPGAKLKKLFVAVPPIELQNEFARFVEQTDKSKFRIKQSLEKLEICYKALLQKYFG